MTTPRIMITNGGAHPSDKWAAITASAITDLIQIDENSASPAAIAARLAKPRLELDLVDIFNTYHANVQANERKLLDDNGDQQLLGDPNDGFLDTPTEAAEAVATAAAKTPFAAHFADPAVKKIIAGIVADHFSKVVDIERSYHADRNPDSEVVKEYKKARNSYGRNSHLYLKDLRTGGDTPKKGKRGSSGPA